MQIVNAAIVKIINITQKYKKIKKEKLLDVLAKIQVVKKITANAIN